MQPHQIEVIDDTSCIIHGCDTSDHVVYDLQGNASKLALGCLLANFEIAANSHGYEISITPHKNKFDIEPNEASYDSHPTFKVVIAKKAKKKHSKALYCLIFKPVVFNVSAWVLDHFQAMKNSN